MPLLRYLLLGFFSESRREFTMFEFHVSHLLALEPRIHGGQYVTSTELRLAVMLASLASRKSSSTVRAITLY